MAEQGQEIQAGLEKKTSGLAIASLVLALFGCTSWLGIILGIVALVKIGKNPELRGTGLAIAGIAVGAFLTLLMLFIIPIVAAIAIPSMMRSQTTMNETAAIGTLRTLVASQAQFRGAGVVDQDNDGTGEYGYFQELTGAAVPRTVGGQVPANVRPGEYITQVLGVVSAKGVAAKSGYHYYIYLPDGKGGATGESLPLPAGNAACANDQETRFICYAWPAAFDSSGRRCFVVNQQGEVFQARNLDASGIPFYEGMAKIPGPDAALLKGHQGAGDLSAPFPDFANNEVGSDGQQWTPAGL